MRITSLLAACAVGALHSIGGVVVETVADDYDRPPAPPKPDPGKTVEESLRVRMARVEREAKDRRRAEAAAKAEAGRNPLHRRG